MSQNFYRDKMRDIPPFSPMQGTVSQNFDKDVSRFFTIKPKEPILKI